MSTLQKIFNYSALFISSLSILLLTSACTVMPKFDRLAYEKAVSLKVDSLALMDNATESYATYENEATELTKRVETAYEYAKGKPQNKIITKQWLIIKDPERHQIGGYLKRWKEKGTLSKTFIEESKKTIAEGFDQVIGLESGLIKGKDKE